MNAQIVLKITNEFTKNKLKEKIIGMIFRGIEKHVY